MNISLAGGSLFTGYGGLDLAAAWVFHELGIDLRFIWDCDVKPAAVTLLAHRRPHAPNLGDITVLDPADVPPVDVLTFGWPCQPHSAAGKRLGEADPRALWPHVHRIIAGLRPTFLFGENVSRVATNGELRRVVRALAEVGYVGVWRCVRAADVGAPHPRDRLFLLAVHGGAAADALGGAAADALGLLLRDEPGRSCGTCRPGAGVAGDDGAQRATEPDRAALTLLPTPGARLGASGSVSAAAAAARASRRGNGPNLDDVVALLPTPTARHGDARRGSPSPEVGRRRLATGRRNLEDSVAAHLVDQTSSWGPYATAVAGWGTLIGRPAPPAALPTGRDEQMQLSPAFVEWMMGLPQGWVTDIPGLTRAQMLSLLGDGVVPQQGAHAYRLLVDDLCEVMGRAVAS